MVLASWSKSRQKVEESSKSLKNLKDLKSCKGHRFRGTFTEAPILCQRTPTFVKVLTVFRALFAAPKKLSRGHFRFNYEQSTANGAADALPRFFLCGDSFLQAPLHQAFICAAHVFPPLLQL